MRASVRRAVREGTEFGLCAGLVFTLSEIVVTFLMRQPIFYPLRRVATAALGPGFIEGLSTGALVLGCLIAQLAMGAVFGVVYALLNACFSDRTQTRWDRQAAIGLLFGAGVWALKLQLVAPVFDPSIVADQRLQFAQLALHVFCFGWPLALFYATAERRLRPLRRAIQAV